MKTGIICIETDWLVTKKRNRLNMDTESLLKFLHEVHQIPYIYRCVATKKELQYYLSQFCKDEYRKKYEIMYFSFHGNSYTIHLEGDNEDISLNELIEIGGNAFLNRFVHFSSCRTMFRDESIALEFKRNTKAKLVSGYSKSVNAASAAIHDISLFDTILRYSQKPSIIKRMNETFGALGKELGFKIY